MLRPALNCQCCLSVVLVVIFTYQTAHHVNYNSAVRYCSDVSKNRFDLDSAIGQTFGQAIDANG